LQPRIANDMGCRLNRSCRLRIMCDSLCCCQQEDRIMAKGQMKSNKEVRKPKKDAKKPAAAATLKAAPPAAKPKGK